MTSTWWRTAVMLEVYLRSFADADGDGEGDLAGLRARLPYLKDLGVDGIWVTPWYPSPMADGGYDVSDYRDIDPRFGTLADADALLADAHALDLRVITDMVPNHTSERHAWFQAALAAAPGSPERGRYLFRDGRGPEGDEPPNNWISAFGGSAWTRIREADGRPGQWYLHTFAEEQPDLDWTNEAVLTDFDDILRFWFDRGVDGLRVDAAPALAKAPGLPDADYGDAPRFVTVEWEDNPHWDVDAVHEVFRRWRRIADEYADRGERIFVAEAVVNGAERLGRYLRPDELHSAFNFPYLKSAWEADAVRRVVGDTLDAVVAIGAPPTWALSSHDEVRLVTRYGRATTSAAHLADGVGEVSDPVLGTRRARAAALLMLALPGGAYLYQGEELGLPEVQDLREEVLQDPIFLRTDGENRGRDGCRVPLPWSGTEPPFGFSPPGTRTWLPQPADWTPLTVEAQQADPASTLSMHREALRIRRAEPALAGLDLTWLESPAGALAFERGGAFRCLVNLSAQPLAIGPGEVLLSSAPVADRLLPTDAAVWMRTRR
ncbi:MAG TPA: glycoside hydrolase family 13 protein [Amnibacterium sp.]|nr:glycoside hydrolase family 13 protein [Amnibacterium sp.]